MEQCKKTNKEVEACKRTLTVWIDSKFTQYINNLMMVPFWQKIVLELKGGKWNSPQL